MKRGLVALPCLLAGLVLCLALPGCGRKVKVRGKLTHGATALKGQERQPLVVTFVPYQEGDKGPDKTYTAQVDQGAGTYEVDVPPGKYRIAVSRFTADLSDQFKGAFSEGKSPIIRDVKGDETIDLDLSKPSG
jgi:hypothetical protein